MASRFEMLQRRFANRLNHPRNANVRFAKRAFFAKTKRGWIRANGLRNIMEKAFFQKPGKKALEKALRAGKKTVPSVKAAPAGKTVSGMTDEEFDDFSRANAEEVGMSRGTQVHEELEMLIKHPAEFSNRVKITKEYHERLRIAEEVRKEKRRKNRTPGAPAWERGIDPPKPPTLLHSYTIRIMEKLNEWKWTPIASEFQVYDEINDNVVYATAIDFICVTQTGSFVLVELKNGYNHTFTTGTRPMRLPLGKYLSNSFLSQAMLQVYIPMLTLRFKYKFDVRACVMLADDHSVRVQPVSKELERDAEKLYPQLMRRLEQQKR